MTKIPGAEEIVKKLSEKFNGKVRDIREDRHVHGKKKTSNLSYWITIDRSVFKDAVKEICDINYPFLSVISGRDAGEDIELIYHLYVNFGGKLQEQGINLCVFLPKSNPVLPTITDLIPGAILSEQEKQEMLGVDIQGIDNERAFLPENHPKGNYPWRKDKNA
ncbi:MAG: NADH-quinone oxidoreductase subunit C [Candidatus Woesearchaeota archaeon]